MIDLPRLQHLARRGDPHAISTLLTHARRRGDHLAVARALASGPPSVRAWGLLCDALDATPSPPPEALTDLDARLSHWPDDRRDVIPRWRDRVLNGDTLPHGLPLTRTLFLQGRPRRDPFERLLHAPLHHLTGAHLSCFEAVDPAALHDTPWLRGLRTLSVRGWMSEEVAATLRALFEPYTQFVLPWRNDNPNFSRRDQLRALIVSDIPTWQTWGTQRRLFLDLNDQGEPARSPSSFDEAALWLDLIDSPHLDEQGVAAMMLAGVEGPGFLDLVVENGHLDDALRERLLSFACDDLLGPITTHDDYQPTRQMMRAAGVRLIEMCEPVAVRRKARLMEGLDHPLEQAPCLWAPDPVMRALNETGGDPAGLVACLEQQVARSPVLAIRGLVEAAPTIARRRLTEQLRMKRTYTPRLEAALSLIDEVGYSPEEVTAQVVPALMRHLDPSSPDFTRPLQRIVHSLLQQLCTLRALSDAQVRALLCPLVRVGEGRFGGPLIGERVGTWGTLQRVLVTTLGRRPVDDAWIIDCCEFAFTRGNSRDRRVVMGDMGQHATRLPEVARWLSSEGPTPENREDHER